MGRYSLNSSGISDADAYLDKIADRAEPLKPADAEDLFHREWQRLRARKAEAGKEDVRSAILIGLAAMRSMTRYG